MIRRSFWRLLREEGGWTRIWYGLATAMVIAGGGLIYHQTNGNNPPDAPSEGWLLTTSNIGLARFGLTCSGLSSYTTNPIPAGTHIFRKRITWSSGQLNLEAGGITIEQSCMQPSAGGTESFVTVGSFNPPNPNRIIDSELDGSNLGQSEVSKACGLRGIWAEITRTYVHDVGSGICLVDQDETLTYDVVYTNNLIVDLRAFGDGAGSGSHNEAATTRCFRIDLNPSRQMVWDGNWIETDATGGTNNDSGGLFIQHTFGCPIGNLYIRNNYLSDPSNYPIFADGASSGYSGQFELVNNRFGPNGFGDCSISGFTFDVQTGNSRYNASNPPNYNGSTVTC